MMLLDKNVFPNLAAIALIIVGWLLPGSVGTVVFYTGLFALSGAVTNWLAVHMLFEKVPGLYGSCLLYTSPSPRDATLSRMPSSA